MGNDEELGRRALEELRRRIAPNPTDDGLAPDDGGTLPTPEEWLQLSWQLEDKVDVEGSMMAAAAGLEVAKRREAAAAVLDITCQIARIYRRWHDTTQPLQTLAAAVPWARRCTDKGALARYYGLYSFYLGERDELEKAMTMGWKALGYARSGGPDALYLVLVHVGEQWLRVDRIDEAISFLTEAYETFAAIPLDGNTDYRYCYSRAMLSAALCERADRRQRQGLPVDMVALAEVDRLAAEALHRSEASVPILIPLARFVLGRCRALAGIADEENRRLVLATSPPLVWIAPGRTQWTAIAWARYEAEVRGDPCFARDLLNLLKDPSEGNRWIDWMPEWHAVCGIIHRLGGHHEAACESFQAAFRAERQSRSRHTTALLELSDRLQKEEANRRSERAVARREAKLRMLNEKLSAERQRLTQDALTDPLTRIGNRRLLEQTVETLERRRRRGMVTVAIIDIDHFKAINDRFSHQIGDQVIAAVARQLVASSRPSDLCVRWGGEEFLILFKGIVSARRLDALLDVIQDHDWSAIAEGLTVTASLGAAAWAQGDPFHAALTLADKRLYTAKFLGRNRVVMV